MNDFSDKGTDPGELFLAVAIANHKNKAVLPAESALTCEDCGTDIPLKRREGVKGCQTCVDCQHLREVSRG